MFKSTGRKGVFAGIALMVFAIIGVVLNQIGVESSISLNLQAAAQLFLEGLGILGIRLAIK